ncbi:hypothetical protein [Streptomyces canus]|uniref:hypothetical protein n=1 Tax=Streptomyces canus TaxID=58343 RepID=UPI0030E353AD
MAHGRAAIPALVAEVLLTAFLWSAGAGAQELHLPGTAGVSGGRAAAVLQQWLTHWSYDSPASVRFGAEVPGQIGDAAGSDGIRYPELYATALQIRFAAVFAFFVPGALLLVRRLPPGHGRMPAALLAAVWFWHWWPGSWR